MHLINNVCKTTMCILQPYSMVVIMHNTQEKADLKKTKVNAMKVRKVCADRNKLRIGKEWRLAI